MDELLFLILKVLAPILVKLSLMEDLMDSIAVCIPTKAVIPIAIMKIVSTVRSRFVRIDCRAIFIFLPSTSLSANVRFCLVKMN